MVKLIDGASDIRQGLSNMGNVKKWRKKKMSKKHHRRVLEKTRWERRRK